MSGRQLLSGFRSLAPAREKADGIQWCYIGKRTLEKAISLYQKTYPGGKDDRFSIAWQPYYLDQNPPARSVDKRELREQRLSGISPERATEMIQRLAQIGHSVGIDFKFGGRHGSTRDAHRLTLLSQTKTASPEIQDKIVEKLFEAYHELEKDISSPDVLREIAVDAGLDESEVGEWLVSNLGGDIVDAEARRNREAGISGVPMFIIQGEHRVDGARDVGEFLETFIKVKERGNP